MHDLQNRAIAEDEAAAIQGTLLDTSGVQGIHDLRTRKTGDMIVADAHLEIGTGLTVEEGHKPIPLFGLEVPALVSPDKALADQVKELHETLATVGYFLVGLHAAAALLHHYVFRDNTLVRMLPGRR
ncbi:cation transporter dimerization domain-containing protein [Achromobacter sp.]|uniref:cation transporter dimerization domain-containing protein n=1 Tax=Achromobacter sp. TaxID=134375 RepID=UPI003D0294C0